MSSLVADYGSSSDSTSSDEDYKNTNKCSRTSVKNDFKKLPLPKFGKEGVGIKNSVFKNPFVEEENAKSAILEKHVKMIPAKDDITQINGKQICWMYRKGRCRFGHNCKYAHDSDLYSEASTDSSDQPETSVICESLPNSVQISEKLNLLEVVNSEVLKKKKRPGLTQGLVPGKKTMSMYKKQKISNKKI